jgi:leucyl/phenylalanyl-tRNA--protein transferase
VHTTHLARFGAREIPRTEFLDALDAALREPTRRGPFELELTPTDALARLLAS